MYGCVLSCQLYTAVSKNIIFRSIAKGTDKTGEADGILDVG